HAERVLQAAFEEADIRPAVRAVASIEIDLERLRAEADRCDVRTFVPEAEIARVVDDDRVPHVERLIPELESRRELRSDAVRRIAGLDAPEVRARRRVGRHLI